MNRRIAHYRKLLAQARTYEQWKAAALELDYLEGNVEWKEEFASEFYNYNLIHDRLRELRHYHQTGDYARLKRAIREGLHHDLGNISNPALYHNSYVGTKHLIEEYVNQVCESINLLCDTPMPELPESEKLGFFKDTLLSYGRPALLLSGGATLGLFHLGVIRTLWERDLLPQVISGSSAGAVMAAMVGTTPDDELDQLLEPERHNLKAWRWKGVINGLRGAGFMDQGVLEQCLRENIGEFTFEEAFQHTGRSTNISVSSDQGQYGARLLSGYTSPYMLVWSAALASSAVPGVSPPVQLQKKDHQGATVPYMPRLRFVDGSVVSDLPRERLMHLYDVNFTLVSQTNPHVVPFLRRDHGQSRESLASLPLSLLRAEMQFHGKGLFDVLRRRMRPELARQACGQIYTIMSQQYQGDVTLAPRYRLRHFRRMMSNPSPEFVREMMLEGERATWPLISQIRTHAKISRTLEGCIRRLRQHNRKGAELHVIAS